MNFRKLDLNLLRVFDTIFTEGSTKLAAGKLGMSQPAVSNALTRLRQQLDDPLFERAGQKIAPTDRARALAPQIREALATVEKALVDKPDFDPASSRRHFTMLIPDAVEPQIMTNLVLTNEMIKSELEVVLEERAQRTDNDPSAQLSETLSSVLFSYSPYGIPIIGWENEIRELDVDDAMFPVVALAISTVLENYQWTMIAGFGTVLALSGNLLVLTRPKSRLADENTGPSGNDAPD